MKQPAYQHIEKINSISIVRHAENGKLYAARFDQTTGQVRRISLRTDRISDACEAVRSCLDAGFEDEFIDFLRRRRIVTVRDLLTWHQLGLELSPSREIEKINIKILLESQIADRRLAGLMPQDFEALRASWMAPGTAISTVSRRLSTLRAAGYRAIKAREISAIIMPKVPEVRTRNHILSAKPKGDACSAAELARLYDAIEQPHLKVLFALLFATASRSGALLDLTREQCHPQFGLIELNQPGRQQTKKWRPTIRLIKPMVAWIEPAPPGLLVHWRGNAVHSIKTGLKAARVKAGLSPRVNTYSVRHSAGRHLRRNGVRMDDISLWLGHQRTREGSESTEVYAPYSPEYLDDAVRAMTLFFEEIASYATTPLLTPPPDVLAYFDVQRDLLLRHRRPDVPLELTPSSTPVTKDDIT